MQVFCKPRNANPNQVNARIPNDFFKILPRNFRLQKWFPRDLDSLSKIFLSIWRNEIAEFSLAYRLYRSSKCLPWLSTRWQLLKRLRQAVLGLDRGVQRCQRYADILSARHVFAAVFKPPLIDRFSHRLAHRRRILRLFKEDTHVKRITLVIWTTARLPRFPIRGTLFRYTPEGFSFSDMEHFSTDLHIFLANIRWIELENNSFIS